MLDFSSLKKAIHQLKESLQIYDSKIVQDHPKLKLYMRSAAIQSFEYTYELSIKMLRRYMGIISSNPNEVKEWSFENLIRECWGHGILSAELVEWKKYRKYRGITSHTYDGEKAKEVFQVLPIFLKEANYLLNQLEERNKNIEY